MATNSRETQRKADAKRAGTRARAWTGVAYPPEGCEDLTEWREGLLERLRGAGLDWLVSPIHDRDKTATGEDKKPHCHIVAIWDNPTSPKVAYDTLVDAGAVVPAIVGDDGKDNPGLFIKTCKVKSLPHMARYLVHMDDPNKTRYDEAGVSSIGGVDYVALALSGADEDEILDALFDEIDTHCLTTYPQVVRYIKVAHPSWKSLVYRKFTRQIGEYVRGVRYEMRDAWEQERRAVERRETPRDDAATD